MKLLRHVSFVDCPGHDILMATMLNGAAVMDGALLLIAANETCPQPQTSEHLAAVEIMRLKHIIILQNKIDLVTESAAHNQFDAISRFIQVRQKGRKRCACCAHPLDAPASAVAAAAAGPSGPGPAAQRACPRRLARAGDDCGGRAGGARLGAAAVQCGCGVRVHRQAHPSPHPRLCVAAAGACWWLAPGLRLRLCLCCAPHLHAPTGPCAQHRLGREACSPVAAASSSSSRR